MENMQGILTEWLKESIREGRISGPIEGMFPRYVWYCNEGRWFAGRLTNQTLGEYKGYPVSPDETPEQLRGRANS